MIALPDAIAPESILLPIESRELVPVRIERDEDGVLAASVDRDDPNALMLLIPIETLRSESIEDLEIVADDEDADTPPLPGTLIAFLVVAGTTLAAVVPLAIFSPSAFHIVVGLVAGAVAILACFGLMAADVGRRAGVVEPPQGVDP